MVGRSDYLFSEPLNDFAFCIEIFGSSTKACLVKIYVSNMGGSLWRRRTFKFGSKIYKRINGIYYLGEDNEVSFIEMHPEKILRQISFSNKMLELRNNAKSVALVKIEKEQKSLIEKEIPEMMGKIDSKVNQELQPYETTLLKLRKEHLETLKVVTKKTLDILKGIVDVLAVLKVPKFDEQIIKDITNTLHEFSMTTPKMEGNNPLWLKLDEKHKLLKMSEKAFQFLKHGAYVLIKSGVTQFFGYQQQEEEQEATTTSKEDTGGGPKLLGLLKLKLDEINQYTNEVLQIRQEILLTIGSRHHHHAFPSSSSTTKSSRKRSIDQVHSSEPDPNR